MVASGVLLGGAELNGTTSVPAVSLLGRHNMRFPVAELYCVPFTPIDHVFYIPVSAENLLTPGWCSTV